jgi:hypothetical protein
VREGRIKPPLLMHISSVYHGLSTVDGQGNEAPIGRFSSLRPWLLERTMEDQDLGNEVIDIYEEMSDLLDSSNIFGDTDD